ncbi:GNAT family N-acetyltransferase [Sphingomonas sp. 1P06PA]|uniref:GNAT family N-acetyltransferase n=1 Tax=Sphingomonas sp. 1P06PA TaxID=554121 RepID=UPI0039A67715
MTITVALFEDLRAVAADAAGALDRDRQASLHDRIDWLCAMADHGLGGRPLVARARDSFGNAAWLPLAADGRAAHAYACWYTLDYRPSFAGDGDHDALLIAIAVALKPMFDRIVLAPMQIDQAERVTAGFSRAGWRAETTTTSVNWRTAIPPDPADWWAARPGRLRSTLARKERASGLRYRIVDRFDSALWADYEAIYADSWKPAEGSPGFLRALAEREGAAGALRLGVAFAGSDPVAAQFWLSEHGIATIHKLAHRRAADPLSAGTLLTAAMFRHVFAADRPAIVDFGTGDDAYKADWMEQARPLVTLTLTRRGSIADLAARGRALVRRIRSD